MIARACYVTCDECGAPGPVECFEGADESIVTGEVLAGICLTCDAQLSALLESDIGEAFVSLNR